MGEKMVSARTQAEGVDIGWFCSAEVDGPSNGLHFINSSQAQLKWLVFLFFGTKFIYTI